MACEPLTTAELADLAFGLAGPMPMHRVSLHTTLRLLATVAAAQADRDAALARAATLTAALGDVFALGRELHDGTSRPVSLHATWTTYFSPWRSWGRLSQDAWSAEAKAVWARLEAAEALLAAPPAEGAE